MHLVRRVIAGSASVALGVIVLLVWAEVLVKRGYDVDEAGAEGYSLVTDYVLLGVAIALIAAPIVIWFVNGYRRLVDGRGEGEPE